MQIYNTALLVRFDDATTTPTYRGVYVAGVVTVILL